jgi:ABC-type bacteriocin/lantibiotic exporter with double-glycine peptidase domain
MSSLHGSRRGFNSGRWKWAGALALACVACASQPKRAEMLSKDAVVLSLPLMSQDEMYQCGLVSLAVLCEYYHRPIPEAERKELATMATERKGLSGAELTQALERLGFEAFLFEGTLDRSDTGLYHHVDAGRPLIVMTSTNGEDHHYSLFLGYDEPLGNVCLLDPVLGRVMEPSLTFGRAWERCQRFTLLALPKEVAAPTGAQAAPGPGRKSVP